jgi:hypothetical protein
MKILRETLKGQILFLNATETPNRSNWKDNDSNVL